MSRKLAVLLLGMLLSTSFAKNCITPNNVTAECLNLKECPALEGLLETEGRNTSKKFFYDSICGGSGLDPMVCCGPHTDFINVVIPNGLLLPDESVCGYQHSDDYFHNMNVTQINEFPWLATMYYKYENESNPIVFHCSGSLINEKYVLTAASCIAFSSKYPIIVRLGEYNIKTETDCTEDSDVQECSDPVEEVGVAKVISHPMYNSVTFVNDIALLRLTRTIEFSDYIRPICLPSDEMESMKTGDILTSSGWGTRDHKSNDNVEVKKKIHSRVISNTECSNIFNGRFEIIDDHICTVEESNFTSDIKCTGDGGGPLLLSHKKAHWHQVGVISVKIGGCNSLFPSIHTRVARYIKWIHDHLEKW